MLSSFELVIGHAPEQVDSEGLSPRDHGPANVIGFRPITLRTSAGFSAGDVASERHPAVVKSLKILTLLIYFYMLTVFHA